MQDAVFISIKDDIIHNQVFESRKCEKRRYFNKKAKCRMGYFKCATDPNLKLIKSTYQEALKKCKIFSSINETDIDFIRTQIIPHNRHFGQDRNLFVPVWTQLTRYNLTHFHDQSEFYEMHEMKTKFNEVFDNRFEGHVISNLDGKKQEHSHKLLLS